MLQILKKLLKTTRVQDESLSRRASVLRILFAATFGVLGLSAIAIIAAYFTGFNRLVLHRLVAVVISIGVTGGLYACLKRQRYFIAASGLLLIYWLIATIMAVTWGVTLPIALLLYCALIVLSGIVLGASYAIITLGASMLALYVIQSAIVRGSIHPNFYWQTQSPHLSDLVVYYFVFILVGISSWLFNRETDRSLHRALRAESALQREKELLETKVIARTKALQKAQEEKIRQLHRFAELGQFSTSLLHDLSNHITTLSVDIEGMAEKQKQSESQIQLRIKRRIAYIDAMMQWAHDHINGKVQDTSFNAAHEIREVIKMLQFKARKSHVKILSTPAKLPALPLYGDPNRFKQLIVNLVSNAIESYSIAPPDSAREVQIEGGLEADGSVQIAVRDHGGGISAHIQKNIFDPFYTTKEDGMGIGLFVVKQIAEEYFDGSIQLVSQKGETCFTVILRRTHEQSNG
ncbi:MAG TPA: HAMP domain-containing sensor histidine kinase [Candidatus Saccharimonadia bacterium]|nr:HAMP domain-containing sensor histidine kinase [Candidatus Saccharimonadia bacterium]